MNEIEQWRDIQKNSAICFDRGPKNRGAKHFRDFCYEHIKHRR